MMSLSDPSDRREALYADKTAGYFAGARHDMVEMLTTGADASVIEIGCGNGATGAATLSAGKASRYTGIELVPEIAAAARLVLSEVVTGNVEVIDLTHLHDQFDGLIMSEVIEHLTDPWATLAKLAQCLRPGGEVIASSPNIAHRGVIGGLLSGRFDYTQAGVMDRTHLRWFTPASYHALFAGAGFVDIRVMPVRAPGLLPRLFNRLTRNRFAHLSMTQIMIHARTRSP